MKKLLFLTILVGSLGNLTNTAQDPVKLKGLDVITEEAIQAQLEFLASDWMEGRATAEKGIFLAGDYVASMFKFSGIEAAGDLNTMRFRRRGADGPPPREREYFQNFTLLESVPDGGSVMSLKKGTTEIFFQQDVDFSVNRATASMKVEAPLVFVGYGIRSEEFGLDDFSGADLKGKIIIRLAGFPGMNDEESDMYKKIMEDRRAAYQLNRDKNDVLEELGVLAVIELDLNSDITRQWGTINEESILAPNESSWRSDWTRMRLDDPIAGSDPVILNGSRKVANTILSGSGLDLDKYETDAGAGRSFKPLEIRNIVIGLDIKVTSRRVRVRNVVGMIEGENKDEIIAVGAHMDHMGKSGGRIWNGADDNGSGTVGMMTIAQACAATGVKPKRTIVFCAWTGEEKGLLGSKYYIMNPTIGETGNYKLYLNYDMISRDSPNDEEKKNCSLTYTEAAQYIEDMTRKNMEEYDIDLNLSFRPSEAPRGGSDHTSFTDQEIPIMYMMAGFPEEYHTVDDEVNLVNWDKMLQIIKLGFLNIWDAANTE